ncbi:MULTISPECIES: ABC transporter ATP-binding protein [unclassified Moorena]|uniref:ABC transporter ATP-binding protein n=1 Tax=unclassified Moorena TaxID=2683338 RepID=UPI0013CCBECE|nr:MULTISPECIES: ABC transporter ATP-binding protein [unclassified Moorena]NEO22012.1 ABC transporter ATP-binding protein [Moorena sp. SIO4A5]NEQ60862.1 ABC transporter ATP-binding protein [Moorena sp. SIO4A1]
MTDNVLDVRNLKVQFQTDVKQVTAVDSIDFQLRRGQTLGIVGESGSGKSVTSLAIMGLIPYPGKVTNGEIYFRPSTREKGVDLLGVSPDQKQSYRGGQISMIFQEPMTSLNPVYTCGFQLTEAILQHQDVSLKEARRQAMARLQEVKLLPSDQQLRETFLEEFRRENPGQAIPGERLINRHINQQKREILKRYPHELSGGQLQRVMIAIAISCNPDVLIADEPTTALDVTVQATILDLLRELRDTRGMSMIFITHDLGVIAEIADSVAVMYQGKIVERGDVWKIFSEPNHPYTKGLLACRPTLDQTITYLPTVSDFMEVVTTPSGEQVIREKSKGLNVDRFQLQTSSDNLPYGNAKGEQPSSFQPSTSQPSTKQPSTKQPWPKGHATRTTFNQTTTPPLVSVRNLQVGFPIRGVFGGTKRYLMAVNGVSFDVYPSETLGLVGESGCGKSTLARTLLRLIEPMGGEVNFDGQEITKIKGMGLRQLRREMQIVFQNPFSSLDPRLKIGEAVMEPLLIHDVGGNSKEKRDRVAELLERVDLNPDWMNRYPHEFSGGQRQRVCIARALALNPKFIICDESVSALDVSVQAQVLNLLKQLQEDFGLTYIFISHDLSVVKFMSDRIMVMNQGKIEEIGPADNIYREPKQDYTRQLIASIPTGTLDRIQQQQHRRQAMEIPEISDPWSVNSEISDPWSVN